MPNKIAILSIAALALVVAGAVAYLGLSQAPTQEQQEQGRQGMREEAAPAVTQPVEVPKVPFSPPEEAPAITTPQVEDSKFLVSDDGSSIILVENNSKKIIFSVQDLPSKIFTETHGERYGALYAEFKSVRLSPGANKIAITWESIDAWLGVLELDSKRFYPLLFGPQDCVDKSPTWFPNGRYVAIELTVCEGTGTSYIKIGDALERKEILTINTSIPEIERALTKIGILVGNFESPRWLDDNTLFFDLMEETWAIDVDGSNARRVEVTGFED